MNNEVKTNYNTVFSSKADHPRRHVFPVTWQRWWSHHFIHHSHNDHAACKLQVCDSICYRSEVIAKWSFTLREYEISCFFAAV